MFDNPRVRGLYASLSDGWVYLNAATNPQLPEKVAGAVSRAFRTAPLLAPAEITAGSHGRTAKAGTRVGESHIDAARVAIADLTRSRPECVVLGNSRRQLLSDMADKLSRRLAFGREMVLSRVDDAANITPWRTAAKLYGARVRWAEPDLSTGVLPVWQYTDLVGPSTALVAVAAANTHVGTMTDVSSIGRTVHSKSRGVFVVDANAVAPFEPIDIDALDADVLALDVAALGGPEIGALVFRSPEFMSSLFPPSAIPDAETQHGSMLLQASGLHPGVAQARRLLEPQKLSEGLLGGVAAAVEHWADMGSDSLGNAVTGTRRRKLRDGLPPATDYVHSLARRVVDGLQVQLGVHVIGIDGEFDRSFGYDSVRRIPRVSFFVDGVPAEMVEERLLSQGIVTSIVQPGDSELFEQMGVFEAGTGAICVGLSVHNTATDVNRLLRAVGSLR